MNDGSGTSSSPRPARAPQLVLALLAVLALGACASGPPREKPTRADKRVAKIDEAVSRRAAARAGSEAEGAFGPAPQPIASPLTDHFALRGTYYRPSITTSGAFDSDAGTAGTLFSGENDFGLADSANQGRMELLWRIRDQHRVRADYLKLDRFGDRVLDRGIRFRNQIFNLRDRVETDFNLRALGLTYVWLPLKRERFELGIGAGLHMIEVAAIAQVRARGIREEGSGVGVLPTLTLDGTWRFARRWSVSGRLQYLKVSANDIDGSFADHHVDVQYRWTRNLALGLGYSMFKLDADIDDTDLPGNFVLDTKGPELFFRVSF